MSAPANDGSRSPGRRGHRRSPSPPPRRGRHRDAGGRELIVQRVVKEVGGSANYPILSKTNYSDWALMMKVMMQARGLWDAVNIGDAEFQEDRMAMEAILRAVPAEMISTLAVKTSAKEAWDAVKAMHVGSDRVRKAKAQQLRKEFEAVAFRDVLDGIGKGLDPRLHITEIAKPYAMELLRFNEAGVEVLVKKWVLNQ